MKHDAPQTYIKTYFIFYKNINRSSENLTYLSSEIWNSIPQS